MMMYYGNGIIGNGMTIFIIVLVILVGVYFIVKLSMNSNNRKDITNESNNINNVNRNALNILDERYARGEISEEEYAHKKEQLRR